MAATTQQNAQKTVDVKGNFAQRPKLLEILNFCIDRPCLCRYQNGYRVLNTMIRCQNVSMILL
jgi:hypothetical protein